MVSMSNGRSRMVEVSAVPDGVSLATGWQLGLESWGPDALTNLIDPTLSAKSTVEFSDVDLGRWSDLPASAAQLEQLGVASMGHVSGVGRYRNAFTLPDDWTRNVGAHLHLSHGDDMVAEVKVNGATIDDIDQFTDTVDLGTLLRPGENVVEVKLATTLARRMVAERGGSTTQVYGLTAVQIEPYVQSAVRGS